MGVFSQSAPCRPEVVLATDSDGVGGCNIGGFNYLCAYELASVYMLIVISVCALLC